MPKTISKPNRTLLKDLRRLGRLMDAKRYDEARALATSIEERGGELARQSPFLVWIQAVIADYVGDVEHALDVAQRALALDPYSINANQSLGIIVKRVRDALADEDRDAKDPSTARLYALLQKVNATDERVHVAYARHLAATGRTREAMALLDAVTALHPRFAPAWKLLGMLAAEAGDEDRMVEANMRAANLDEPIDSTWPCPEVAEA